MKEMLTLGALFLSATMSHAADVYTIDPRHTFPSFEISHFGFSTQRGRFNKTMGKIVLDRPAKSGSVEVTIDTASIDTGLDKLEEHLRGVDFFNTTIYSSMTFKSSKITFNADALDKVEGELTMLGVTKPLTLSVTRFRCGIHPTLKREVCGADVTGTLKRSDFGMKYALPAVGDEVKLIIQVEAIKG
jgi:polyisoprenoid-binding protein YceI